MPTRYRLRRRGVDHGLVAPAPRRTSRGRAEPVVLRGLFRPPRMDGELGRRLRGGEELPHLLRLPRGFRWDGLSQNLADPLELQKACVAPGGLWIKANWLSVHPSDDSLRLRCSYGAEVEDDWRDDPRRGTLLLRLVEGLFPEARLVTRSRRLRARIGRVRFLQPIVYVNAPNGGALFHHDFVPGQEGVVFAQWVGRTAWLALPWRELARQVEAHLGRRVPRLAQRVERRDPALDRLLNRTPAFTRRLAAEGWMFVLSPGDATLLPSPDEEGTAWHSVFCVGRGANLALSMGYGSCRT